MVMVEIYNNTPFQRKKKLGDLSEISTKVQSCTNQLADKVTYPLVSAENGYTVNKKIEYGNVKRYGAIGDGVSDDTIAFQKAIDASDTIGCEVKVPEGKYRINGTLFLPSVVTIRGVNKERDTYASGGTKRNCTLETYNKNVFRGKNESNGEVIMRLTMENLFFHNKYTPETDSVLLKNIRHLKSYVNNISTLGYGTIFYGTLEGVSVVSNCNFEGIFKYFINSSPETDGFSTSYNTLVDSFIHHNYINGTPTKNATLFNLYFPAYSVISENYMDFAKYVIRYLGGGANAMTITGNIIDYCYRGIVGAISRSKITNNSFTNIQKSNSSKFTSPDIEMVNNDWISIDSDGATNYSVISNNQTVKTTHFLKLVGWGFSNSKITNNVYDEIIVSKVQYSTRKRTSPINTDAENMFFDDLMYIQVSTLPDPTLTSAATDSITTFNNQIVKYNNKLVFNNNGVWMDMLGNTVT